MISIISCCAEKRQFCHYSEKKKLMTIEVSRTIAELVAENIKAAHVFRKYGIDFCGGGETTLKTISGTANVPFEQLAEELAEVDMPLEPLPDFSSWKADALADYISNVHHKYIEENIPLIISYAAQVVQKYAGDHPGLIQIQRLFSESVIELGGHTLKEENLLFPFIKEMQKAEEKGIKLEKPSFDTVHNPIRVMEQEHNEVETVFRRISALSGNYMPPVGACHTFKAFYSKLKEFDQDLQQHVHLENEILFPKALQMEKSLF